MVIHHGLLEALLTVFKDELGKSSQRAAETLDNFQWEFEKHIFGEEKVIFRLCKQQEPEICELVKKMEGEHTVMLNILEELKKSDLTVENEAKAKKFYDFLVRHREVEENELYPRMDQELSDEVKEDIISRIDEIPIKK